MGHVLGTALKWVGQGVVDGGFTGLPPLTAQDYLAAGFQFAADIAIGYAIGMALSFAVTTVIGVAPVFLVGFAMPAAFVQVP